MGFKDKRIRADGTGQGAEQFYQVIISNVGALERTVTVRAAVPENISTEFDAEWAPLLGEITGKAQGAASLTGGQTFSTRRLSPLAWQGNSPLSLTLPLKLRAESDAMTEVVQPIIDLLKITSPINRGAGGTIIEPPGPKFDPSGKSGEGIGAVTGGDQTTIVIGRFISFDLVIIDSIDPVFSMVLDPKGIPMSAEVDVTFSTYYPPILGSGINSLGRLFPSALV